MPGHRWAQVAQTRLLGPGRGRVKNVKRSTVSAESVPSVLWSSWIVNLNSVGEAAVVSLLIQ